MLGELRVAELGVIADLTLVLGPGMTALTGETGAGKTLVVEAIELLLGGRADPVLVRPKAAQATVEGRFDGAAAAVAAGDDSDDSDDGGDRDGDDDLVLARIVPASGRSRAYVNGRMAAVSALEQAGRRLVDLHGQHSHQSLLAPSAQRDGLDRFGSIDRSAVEEGRRRLRTLDDALTGLGGDERARAREVDLLRFQVDELDRAGLDDPNEEAQLQAEEEWLADATAHREVAAAAVFGLSGEGAVMDRLGEVVSALAGRGPLTPSQERLRAVAAELDDTALELRAVAESLEDDPQRLALVRERRQLLRGLRRKYGDELVDVIAFREQARRRLEELLGYEARAAALEDDRRQAVAELAAAEAALGQARRSAAPELAAAVEAELHRLAMPRARFEVRVGEDRAGEDRVGEDRAGEDRAGEYRGGEAVTWLLGANPGEPVLPLTKVASGGELARAMLALRLVLGSDLPNGSPARPWGPQTGRTLVFDEVDAGIGGEAAVAVGRALAEVARGHQVLVVTHLPQVAAFADRHVAIKKREAKGRTVAEATILSPEERVVELSRMLSGQPDSATARRHAKELLAFARR